MDYRNTTMFRVLRLIERVGPGATNQELAKALGGERAQTRAAHSITTLAANEMIKRVGGFSQRELIITDYGRSVLQGGPMLRRGMRHSGSPGERRCLCCSERFQSEGYSNRICTACKSNDEWKSPAAVAHVMQEAG